MDIYCCGCKKEVTARLTDGSEIYPHREDLHSLPMWKCNACGNYVGCHHKTKDRTRPLGIIPTSAIRAARMEIHKVMDPIWRSGAMTRKEIYAMVSERVGYKYHTGNIRSIEEAGKIHTIMQEIAYQMREKT